MIHEGARRSRISRSAERDQGAALDLRFFEKNRVKLYLCNLSIDISFIDTLRQPTLTGCLFFCAEAKSSQIPGLTFRSTSYRIKLLHDVEYLFRVDPSGKRSVIHAAKNVGGGDRKLQARRL